MQAVEIAGHILKQQRRRARLTYLVTLFEKLGMSVGITPVGPHARIPVIRNACEIRVERRTQALKHVWQRIFEVTVLALTKPVTRHMNMASKMLFLLVERSDLTAFLRRQQLLQYRAAMGI